MDIHACVFYDMILALGGMVHSFILTHVCKVGRSPLVKHYVETNPEMAIVV